MDNTEQIWAELDPAIQRQAATMIIAAREAGIPLVLVSGRRSEAQNAAAGGAPGSLHRQGLAFDVAVYGYTRDQIPSWWWSQLGMWAEANLGLRWGGRFLWNGKPDVNHFDAGTWI